VGYADAADLQKLDVPCVDPVCRDHQPHTDDEGSELRLRARHSAISISPLPYRALYSQTRETATGLSTRFGQSPARATLHIIGFFWATCRFQHHSSRRDAGAFRFTC
jgi:hypothetical protein